MRHYYYAFMLLCLSFPFCSQSMQHNAIKLAPIAFGTAPVTMPGMYYYAKSGRGENNVFRGFVAGSVFGLIPVMNALCCLVHIDGVLGHYARLSGRLFERWVEDNPDKDYSRRPIGRCEPFCYVCHATVSAKDRAQISDLFAATSLYGSIPCTIKLARRLRIR